jgi:hypothetical protein
MKPKSDSNNTAGAVAQERLVRCGYCLYHDVEYSRRPVMLRDNAGKWTQQTYRLCKDCRKALRGNMKFPPANAQGETQPPAQKL